MKISYVPQANIDKQKWNNCIDTAGNGLIYAYSFYLDAMSKNWDALIMSQGLPSENVYEAVMPLTWNKKYGIYYLYQPAFTASLGVFGNNLSANIVESFLQNIPIKFKYWDIYLNQGNLFTYAAFSSYERSNYVLSLKNNYEKTFSGFSQNHIRNIKKAEKNNCTVKKNIPVKTIIALCKNQSKKNAYHKSDDYSRFSKLYSTLNNQNKANNYAVYSKTDQLLSCAIFLYSHNKAYYILAANDTDVKKTGASHFLINNFIKDHAASGLLLDFEGSNITGIANFYKMFGAIEEKYPGIKMNKLPAILKFIKK